MTTIKIGSKILIMLFTYLFFLNLSINILINGVEPSKAINPFLSWNGCT